MLFHLEMIKTIKKTFCESLNKWGAAHFKGTRTELGKKFKVSQGYISNVLAGRRCGDETWRRMVAKEIGMDYDTMIGIEKNQSKNILNFETIEDEKHFEITQKFKNKPLAIKINKILVDLEKIDKQELEDALFYFENRLALTQKKL